ncbi:prohibitin family protein [Bacteroides sp. 214]|uniref:prohibitin family protein n=1 Tax=Bacteroides sp. 214 TaxID=2302935 RepID=UPI0013D02145|nr:prohibitin family protein [Bacteroides sp. 214]NDW13416.1 prohibitin family protein [Bacteroides sp. 214]
MEVSKRLISTIAIVGLLAILAFSSFYTINTGERGVVLRLGKLEGVVGEGLHMKVPFMDDIQILSIRDRNLTLNTEVSSSDIQTIAVEVGMVYSLDPMKVGTVYQTYAEHIENTLIRPTLAEKINAIIAEYPIEAFVEKRAEISNRIRTTFADQIQGNGVLVKTLLITNHDFSDEFNKAIEDKKIAEQGALAARFTLERMKLEAEAQMIKQASLSPLVIQEMAINKWDGKMPQYFSGSQLPFITIK